MRTISIYNIKGGVAKTTTTVSLAAILASKEKRVLLVDNAPQANATSGFGLYATESPCIQEVMLKEAEIEDVILETNVKNVHIVPSNIRYITAETKIGENPTLLAQALDKVKDNYDYCLIDNDPAINIITTNALVASNDIIIPIRIDKYALDGFSYLLDTISDIQEKHNPSLKILGVLLTQFETNAKVMKSMRKQLKEKLGNLLFNTAIRKNAKFIEAPFFCKTILEYDSNSTGVKDYESLTEEVCSRV
ncbi:ParA family protein [Serpentinicella sp. ANB-PHB4]|uniref:ParA family protein n=1 Tax=Serpentinicella sp. ANB-PHB4 TaxID=3074076 RepID=UPI0028547CB5|nr:ParA family protein [Serpentinicella sp. ANB-PHB4]MDR5659298.1 ParA family protein [Serpentinicella sp. ANB-PHB4]